jgi:excisionase family DNA binding protein
MFMEKETSYVDAQEAAKMLGVNKRTVRNLVARRRLESRRDEAGGAAARLLVSVASVERLRSEQ